ncbi:NAD(P)-dependent alcohol dehydrogenase [Acrocarpospora catenulata]|uniref:NAD(P)-dependent alcohol dehydrogenase n=1 Tax=Acrocarpospora catenulata TaxID=2836182 RepID=UPI001BDAA14C|nr:NAD(P)-dependent alcohol dehydrogenase [Acrocarpospora catenulata]
MKAIVYDRYGPPEVLRYADVDQPPVGPDEVRVRVHATSINFGDRAAIRGIPGLIRLAFGLRRPKHPIPGRDIAGTVDAVGANVTTLRPGDEVFGEVNQRGFAEYAVAPAAHLARKPAEVSFAQAATLPVAATTALQALRLGKAAPGRTVLINGAAGGVGTFAVQLAKSMGATVTGACGPATVDLVRSLGADHVVDHTRESVTGPFDVIVDLAGNHSLSAFRRMLTPKGVLVCSNGTGGRLLGPIPRLLAVALISPFVSQKLTSLVSKRDLDVLAQLGDLVATGALTPVIEATYPLADTAQAVGRHARGKIVLTVP